MAWRRLSGSGVGQPIVPVGTKKEVTVFAAEAETPIVTLDEHERATIRRALLASAGRIHGPGGAAELLGVNGSTLRSRMQKLGVPKLPS